MYPDANSTCTSDIEILIYHYYSCCNYDYSGIVKNDSKEANHLNTYKS